MKKLICVLLLLTFVLGLTACGGPDGKCDECGTDEGVEEVDGKEYCVECALEAALKEAGDELEGLLD
ncbi:MAG: hypothetical protein IJX76_05285 [Clostridia bacterium]|nr:hypothetical protein [Clostridia bacterium]